MKQKDQINVFAHGSYIGTGGYNNHTRDFFRHLSDLINLKVRNFTIGKSWSHLSDEPHNGEPYLNELDKKLVQYQSLWGGDGELKTYPIHSKYKNDFSHNVNLVLSETNHHYYYEDYIGPKIAYNVWESTLQPKEFFDKLLEYDQIWVASKWQAECTIKQGADPNRVKVVPEGVDVNTFYPELVNHKDYNDGRFKFVLFGRWDYRKSTKEIIETFLNTFDKDEPVDLIISVDNPYANDGVETTEDRLALYGLVDKRIKIKHFPSREDYIKYLKKGHIFLSCARSEGWNLPLIEAMACGTPSIYSADSGQMEFAEGKGLPVKIKEHKPANLQDGMFSENLPGEFPEPDFDDLSKVMRDAYVNYDKHKIKAIEDSKIIHEQFNWDKVAEIGRDTLLDFLDNYTTSLDSNKIDITFHPSPKVEITGDNNKVYKVEFCKGDELIFSDNIGNNMWCALPEGDLDINLSVKINGKLVDSVINRLK